MTKETRKLRNNETRRDKKGYNKINIVGEIVKTPRYSHSNNNQIFYETQIKASRIGDKKDIVPIIFSEEVIKHIQIDKGQLVNIEGELRSHNIKDKNNISHTLIFVFAKKIQYYNKKLADMHKNEVVLEGYFCRKPKFRKTPHRIKITDILLAVNRPFGKTDYLPCIAWDELAVFSSKIEMVDRVRIVGRIQSRQYFKRNSPNSNKGKNLTAYEVSIYRIEKI